ncbi:MAG: rod shape-determining protein MreC [Gaiellales bacterium]
MARRLVVAVLVLVSLALLTVYLREDEEGGLHAAQRLGLAIVHPLEVVGERVARPFQDAYGYVSDLVSDKADRDRLELRVQELETRAVQAEAALAENERLRKLVGLVEGPQFADYDRIVTRILVQPPGPFQQKLVVAAGSDAGVALNAPVITADGDLVGLVTNVTPSSAQVTLLTDQSLSVSAVVLGTGARGVVSATQNGSALVLDRVAKDEVVNEGSTVATAGWQVGELSSLYPPWIRIGTVTSVGQRDIDLFKQIQVEPAADLDELSEVVILVAR